MAFNARILLVYVMVIIISYCQGLQFFMDTPSDGSSCGHLQCWGDKLFTDPNILSIVSLTVYDVTTPNTKTKLASLSVFDQDLSLDETKINIVQTTGNISDYDVELTLALKDVTACLNRSFMCKLDFVNVDNHHESIQETVSPRDDGSCNLVLSQCSNIAYKIKSHFDSLEAEIAQFKQRNEALEKELAKLLVNSSDEAPLQIECFKGEHYNNTRESFVLWDKVPALCDTETDGGGWIVIQRRTKGDVNFFRGWYDYKTGFGNPKSDFWIGLDVIHNLTSQGFSEMRIDMVYQEKQYFAHYSNFNVADETLNYRLSVSEYNGTAGNILAYQNGMAFHTVDRDLVNCAEKNHGAWWYTNSGCCSGCYVSNLNGVWGAQDATGVVCKMIAVDRSLSFTEIKVRHV